MLHKSLEVQTCRRCRQTFCSIFWLMSGTQVLRILRTLLCNSIYSRGHYPHNTGIDTPLKNGTSDVSISIPLPYSGGCPPPKLQIQISLKFCIWVLYDLNFNAVTFSNQNPILMIRWGGGATTLILLHFFDKVLCFCKFISIRLLTH